MSWGAVYLPGGKSRFSRELDSPIYFCLSIKFSNNYMPISLKSEEYLITHLIIVIIFLPKIALEI